MLHLALFLMSSSPLILITVYHNTSGWISPPTVSQAEIHTAENTFQCPNSRRSNRNGSTPSSSSWRPCRHVAPGRKGRSSTPRRACPCGRRSRQATSRRPPAPRRSRRSRSCVRSALGGEGVPRNKLIDDYPCFMYIHISMHIYWFVYMCMHMTIDK